MANRLLPFRQYDENDVINIFALDTTAVPGLDLSSAVTSSAADAGVFVSVNAATADNLGDPSLSFTDTYVGKIHGGHVGKVGYPKVPWTVIPTAAGGTPLGITLKQTVSHDENGEKLLYNPQKQDELQAVLPGQAVPIATRGLFMLDAGGLAILSASPPSAPVTVGSTFGIGVSGVMTANSGDNSAYVSAGTILAKGNRETGNYSSAPWQSEYYLIKVG